MEIDLNCDAGESYGVYRLGLDEDALPLVSSVNVACGFHASDPVTMRRTVCLAKRHGVSVGAHPSYPDRVGFGRRVLEATPEEVADDVVYQVGALLGFCRAEGVPLCHVKPHGALYNVAASQPALANAIALAVKSIDPRLVLVCLAGSAMVAAAARAGLPHVEEAFADRAYAPDGKLVSRRVAGAVIHEPRLVADRVARMVTERRVAAIDGTLVPIAAQTVCVHGDTPGAVEVIRAIRARLAEVGAAVRGLDPGRPGP
jgi:5-oxoprolinase (ATP-hydrolysing) subunit A